MGKTLMAIVILFGTVLLMGCGGGVVSKHVVGLTPHKLNTKEIDGTWVNDEGAIVLTVIDSKQGILRASFVNDKDYIAGIDSVKIQIMKGDSWLYANFLPDVPNADAFYKWGRVDRKDNRIILWMPSMGEFINAIQEEKIKGSMIIKEANDKQSQVIESVRITDSVENIIRLVESKGGVYFDWEDPIFFIKLTK